MMDNEAQWNKIVYLVWLFIRGGKYTVSAEHSIFLQK